MSKTIDEKVVEMRFDNSKFESNVKTSINTLDKLKSSLNLDKAAKGLDSVNASASKFSSNGLGKAIQTVGLKFSALQVAGVTALANITNAAVNTARRITTELANAVTIQPIKDGFAEYETQMNAVQTILANTQKEGTNVQIVNAALDELNHYADKTIYNFTEMTRNIGTFTAAGVKLDTSVSAIKGIANLAAVSGSTSQQASTAMYQLSQAIATGTVRLMDWNSVVNAGMGGQVFQDALIRTSEHLQTGAKAAIEAKGSFRESLQEGWLTTEVLTETLDQFATAADTEEEYQAAVKKFVDQGYTEEESKQLADMARTAGDAATKVKTFTQLIDTLKEALGSGWTESWRIIIGDFEIAKEMWSKVSDYFSDAINNMSDARNAMLTAWSEGGGREAGIQGIKNVFEGLLSVLKPLKEAFQEVFPPMTAEKLIKLTESFRDLSSKMKLNEEQTTKLKNIFKGLFSLVKTGADFTIKLIGGFVKVLSNFKGIGEYLFNLEAKLGEWISNFSDYIEELDSFGTVINNITGFISFLIDEIKNLFKKTEEKPNTESFDGIKNAVYAVGDALNKVGEVLSKVWNKIEPVLTRISDGFKNALDTGRLKEGTEILLEVFNTGLWASIILSVKKFISALNDTADSNIIETFKTIGESAKNFVDHATKILDSVRDCLKTWQTQLKVGILIELAIAVALLAQSILILSLINPERLAAALTAVSIMLSELMGSLALFNKINGEYKNVGAAVVEMIGLSVAINILASALKKVSSLNMDQLAVGITGITVLLTELIVAMKVLESDGTKTIKGADTMLILAASMRLIAWSLTSVAKLNWQQLAVGMSGITGVMIELVAAMKIMSSLNGGTVNGAGQLIVMSLALGTMAGILKLISTMSWDDLARGLSGLTGCLTILMIAFQIIGYAGADAIKGAGKLIIIAGALSILAASMKSIGSMSWTEIASGLTAIAVSMAILVTGLNSLKNTASVSGIMSLIAVTAALTVLSKNIQSLGSMDWSSIGKGLVGIGSSMLVLVVGLNAMKGTLEGSSAMLVASLAIATFGASLKLIASIPVAGIAIGLVTIAAAIVILGVASSALTEAIPAILAISAGIMMLGVACLGVGVGIAAAVAAITAFFALIAVSGAIISKSLVSIATSFASVVPIMAASIGQGFIAFIKEIANGAVELNAAIKKIILSAIGTFVECVPEMTDSLLKFVVTMFDSLNMYIPQIADSLFTFLMSVMDKLDTYIPKLSQRFVQSLMMLMQNIYDALKDVDTDVLVKGLIGINMLSVLMTSLASLTILGPLAMMGAVVAGEVLSVLAVVMAAIGNIAGKLPGLAPMIEQSGDLLLSLGATIGKFIGGLVGGISAGVSSQLPKIAENLSGFMTNFQPFVDNVKNLDASLLRGATMLASTIMIITGTGFLSAISSVLTGKSTMSVFGKDLAKFGTALKDFSDNVSGINSDEVSSAAKAGKAIAEMASAIPNQGGIASLFAGDNNLSKFGPQLADFGAALKDFSDNVTGVKADQVVAASTAGKAIAEMASYIPNEGGVAAWFAGDNSLGSFAPQIAQFGVCLKAFANNVKGIDAEEVTSAANAAKSIAQMADYIPNEGGIAAWFAGDNSLSAFGPQIARFGVNLKSFADNVKGIDVEGVSSAAESAKTIAEMADYIPNEGGVAAWFAGDNSLSKFGPEIARFGYQLKAFANNVTGIKSEDINPAVDAAKSLAEMVSIIPNEGGVAAWFAGDNSLSAFGPQIARFGVNLKTFSDNVTGISTTDITAAASAGKTLAEMASTLPTNCNRIGSLSDQLGPLAEKLKLFVSSMTGVEVTTSVAQVRRIITLAKDISEVDSSKISAFGRSLKDIGGDGITKFIEAFKNANSQIDTAVDSLLESILTVMTSQQYKFYEEGSDFMLEFYNGLNSKSSTIVNVCKTITSTAKGAMNNFRSDFYSAGEYLVQGFVNGIKDHTYLARNAASSMAREAKRGVEQTLDIHSPSRIMYEDGKYTGMGFVNALNDYGDKSYRAALDMGNSARRGIQDAINKISDFIDSDMDTQPTIRPVLDLSNIKNGASLVNGMFDNTPAIQMAGNINAMVNQRNQNGVNSDIVTAIDKLHKDLQNVSSTSYNINGITYDDGSNISEAIKTLVNAAVVERRM